MQKNTFLSIIWNKKIKRKGTKMERYFLRFGRWRDNEQSAIHKNGEFIVGYEKGVSCFDATLLEDGKWHLILPNPCKINTIDDIHGFMLEAYDNKQIYLVQGDIVGFGSDGEPLLKNLKLVDNVSNQFTYLRTARRG
jgi:hypothetical protein